MKDFRISREGVRALVISEQNGKTRVQVTGIIRGADGTPRELTPPVTLATGSDPDQGVWVSDTTVAVMKGAAAANVTPELLSLTSGQPQQLAPWPGLVALSAGNGAEEIYAQSAEGIFQRLGNGWSPQTQGPDRPVISRLSRWTVPACPQVETCVPGQCPHAACPLPGSGERPKMTGVSSSP